LQSCRTSASHRARGRRTLDRSQRRPRRSRRCASPQLLEGVESASRSLRRNGSASGDLECRHRLPQILRDRSSLQQFPVGGSPTVCFLNEQERKTFTEAMSTKKKRTTQYKDIHNQNYGILL